VSVLQAIVLGVIQGLTEFLPISSDGHLTIVPSVLGWDTPSLSFDLALHAGTLIAVVAYFRADLVAIVRGLATRGAEADRVGDRDDARRLAFWLVLGTIPAGIVGLAFRSSFEALFEEALWACGFWLVTAAALVFGEWKHRRVPERTLTTPMVVAIGIAQVPALAPGISRSGLTIAAGLALGLSRVDAARFSFLLSIPAVAGAVLTEVPDVLDGSFVLDGTVLAGFLGALVVGYLAVSLLLRFVRARSLTPFAVYLVMAAPLAALAL